MSFNPILKVSNLSKSFQGVHAVHDVSFNIKNNEIVGVIGPNGAGKTTLFNLIAGFIQPDRGSVVFNESDITGLRPDKVCSRGLARTFQIVKPFKELTTLDNVVVASFLHEKNKQKATHNAFEVLKLLHLDDKAHQVAEHLTLPERKRLEVARALATQPKLLLLDEVMAGLRPTEVDSMVDILMELNQQTGIAMLVIEHVMRAVMRLSHHIVVMNHGEKIAEGKPDVVTKDPKVLQCYLGEAA